jgi:hypothetical protein
VRPTPIHRGASGFRALPGPRNEFQVASDVLETAIAPSWDQLGILAAIATIRTVLNFFLSREMENERTLVKTNDGARSSAAAISEEPASGRLSAAKRTG